MTGSLDTLFASLDQHVCDLVQERQAAQAQVSALEQENRQLRERLTTLETRLSSVVSHVRAMASLEAEPTAEVARDAESDVTVSALPSTLEQRVEILSDAASTAAEDAGSDSTLSCAEASAATTLTSLSNAETNTDMSSSHDNAAVQAPVDAPSPQQLLKQWYSRYPQAFFKAHTRPLQIGIHEALIAAEPWSARLIRRTLACYVNLPRYMKSVRSGAQRVDLHGQPAGNVTEDEALHAREQLKQLQARQKNREEEQQQRRLSTKLEALQRQHQHG